MSVSSLWMCFAIFLQCFNIGQLSDPMHMLQDPCPAGTLNCLRGKREEIPDVFIDCENSSLTCAPVYECPQAMRDLQSFDQNKIREVQLQYCGERWTTKYVCCPSFQPRDVTQVSKYSGFLWLGYCGRGGTSLLNRDIYDSLIGDGERRKRAAQETDGENGNIHGRYSSEILKRRGSNKAGSQEDSETARPQMGISVYKESEARSASVYARMGQFPWLAALYYPGRTVTSFSYACIGSIITQRFILTSSFCFFQKPDKSVLEDNIPTFVTVGEYDITTTSGDDETNIEFFDGKSQSVLREKPQLFEIANHYFPGVPFKLFENDIALVKIRGQMKYNLYVQPICLPTESETPKEVAPTPGEEAIGVGYAFTRLKVDWGLLKRGVFEVDNLQDCISLYLNKLKLSTPTLAVNSTTTFCARNLDPNPIVCGYDLGGPLMQQAADGRMFLVGVNNYPGVDDCSMSDVLFYTKVEPYIKWIVKTVEVYSSF